MIGNPGNLHSLTPYHGTDAVMVGNEETFPITHIGQATVGNRDSSIKINGDLLVLDIIKYHPSISKLTTDFPLTFEFNGLGFVTKDMITHWIVATSKRKETEGPIYF